jgi:murein DD-endopeptidase MepM/ murein hydrolase activator NlpD
MRVALAGLAAAFLLIVGILCWSKFERHGPRVSTSAAIQVLGRSTPLDFDVQSDAPGLRSVTVRLQSGGTTYDLLSESFPAVSWWRSGVLQKRLHIEPDLVALKVPEGAATIDVSVETYAWHLLPVSYTPRLTVPVTIDLTPPKVEPLTTQHYVRLGGMDVAVFRQSPDTVRSGVQVDKYFFPARTGLFTDAGVALVFFAVPQDLAPDVRPRLFAADAAGNQREMYLPCEIKPRHFAERTLAIDDDFLSRKVPEIAHESGMPVSGDLVQDYLRINRDLRQQNDARIRQVTAHPAAQPLWDGAFRRQSNAAPLSSFADRRTYTYHGDVIDHQTHLGYDLASLKLSPVEAAQNGVVVFAENLGIYGNTVIVDHGLGIFTLYGHLSAIAVQPGEHVKTGQTLGQTGETGLAGGDHLHFSVLLSGVQVDPVEWWDPHWLRDRVTAKLTMFPRAATPAGAEHNDEQARPRDSTPPR